MNCTDHLDFTQEIRISDRARLLITGVEDVRSFDEVSIVLKSNFGMIAVDGRELRITSLSKDTGELFIEGAIGGVIFFDPEENNKKKRKFFGGRS